MTEAQQPLQPVTLPKCLDNLESDTEMIVLSDIIIDSFLENRKREREHPPPDEPE